MTMFSLLRRFIEFVRQIQNEPENEHINSLFSSATWSVGANIDLFTDILGWINDNLEGLKENGAIKVNAVRGDAFAEFIINGQRRHKYLGFSNREIEKISNGVIIVAMDAQGRQIDDHLILSTEGLSTETIKQFHDMPILTINLPI